MPPTAGLPGRVAEMSLILGLIRFLLRHRLWVGALILLSVVACAYEARKIEVRFQYKDFYEYPGNPRLPLLNRYSEEFGDPGSFVMLLVESRDVFTNDILRYVEAVTRELEESKEFLQVKSLTNVNAIRASGEDVESGPLIRRLPLTPDELQRVRSVAVNSSLISKVLAAPDGTATVVLAEMRTPGPSASIPEQQAAVAVVKQVLHRVPVPDGVRAQVTGAPLVEVEVTRSLIDDQLVLTPLLFVVLMVALALTFRSVHGVVLPLASVLVSLFWTAGIFAALGRPLDILGSVIPTTLLVYSIVDPIFVYNRFLDKMPLCRTREQAILEAMRELLMPCFLTSVTTALGFGVFATANLPTIKYFGITVAIGVLLALVTTVTVLPLLLVSFSTPLAGPSKPWIALSTDALMAWLWQHVRARPEVTVALALSVLALGAAAGRGLQISSEYVGNLPNGQVQEGVRVLERKLSGVVRMTVYLEGDENSMKRPEVLRAIEAVERVAQQQPIVTSTLSLADLVSDTNQAFFAGNVEERHVPDSDPLISQYLSMVDPGDLSEFVTSDYSRSHIRILLADHGSRTVWELRDLLQNELEARFPPLGVRATITGYGVVSYYDWDHAVLEVLWGFVMAFSLITALEFVIFRSIRIALFSVVPNLVPVAASFLVMRALNLNLRLDSSIVLCISVGGLFNTTIHIAARVVQQVRAGAHEPDVIVGRALAAVGPPSLYTAVVLSLGFAVLGLSRFPGLKMLGLLCVVTLMTGFASDATITTTLFRWFFNWNRPADLARAQPSSPSLASDSDGPEEEVVS